MRNKTFKKLLLSILILILPNILFYLLVMYNSFLNGNGFIYKFSELNAFCGTVVLGISILGSIIIIFFAYEDF